MKRVMFFVFVITVVLVVTSCQAGIKEDIPVLTPEETAIPEETVTSEETANSKETVASEETATQSDFTTLICQIQYYYNGHISMSEITDEQKIFFGLIEGNYHAQISLSDTIDEETLIFAEDVDKFVNQYFYEGIKEHKSIDSPRLKAEYENGVYRIIEVSGVGANVYSLDAITVLRLPDEDSPTSLHTRYADTPDNEEVIVFTADLLYHNATTSNIVGKSIITLIKKDDIYVIYSYEQVLLNEPINLEWFS